MLLGQNRILGFGPTTAVGGMSLFVKGMDQQWNITIRSTKRMDRCEPSIGGLNDIIDARPACECDAAEDMQLL